MTPRVGVGPTIIGSSILWITVLAQVGFSTEILWIMLAALSFDHARCIWEFRATGTVDHALGNCGIEDRVSDWIRDLRRDNGVDVMCIAYFEPLRQKEQEVDVRQTMLLELYSEDKPLDISKHSRLYIVKHGLSLLNKDVSHNAGVIWGSLMFPGLIRIVIIIVIREEIVINLIPAGVCSHGEEDIWFSTVSSYCH